jgi:hypothetical protein
MKKMMLCVIAMFLLLTSCGDSVSKYNGIIMIGKKPYKLVKVQLDGVYVRMIVPADSSISIVPDNVTYQVRNGKHTETETIIYVN